MNITREHCLEAAARRYHKLMAQPPQPGLYRPFPNNPYIECNGTGLNYIQRLVQTGIHVPLSIRPPDTCMHHADHPCFRPTGTLLMVQLSWYLPLSPAYLPGRDFQPSDIRREHHMQRCCPESAFLVADRMIQAGLATNLHITRLDTEETETINEYANRFFGLKPCWE